MKRGVKIPPGKSGRGEGTPFKERCAMFMSLQLVAWKLWLVIEFLTIHWDQWLLSKVMWTLKNTLKHCSIIWSHQFANYLVLITASCSSASGHKPAQSRTWKSQHKVSILMWLAQSPGCQSNWKCVVCAEEQSERSLVLNQHQRRPQARVAGCMEWTTYAVHQKTFWFNSMSYSHGS